MVVDTALGPPDRHILKRKTSTLEGTLSVNNVDSENKRERTWQIIWINVVLLATLHILGLYGVYLLLTVSKTQSFIFCYFYTYTGGAGLTIGAHRLWSHRAYKARLPLRIILMLMQTVAVQTPIYQWVRDHRVHHKYTDTDADPHNSKRGFFFSHVGWLLMKKHPDVTRCGQGIDMSDIRNDPVVAFQRKYYWILASLLGFVIPTLVPVYCWGETWKISIFLMIKRYAVNLNLTWLVNSAAHMYGTRPYDKRMSPTESWIVSVLTAGEGWHNYHHVYPWDYKASELGGFEVFNIATLFIDFFYLIGLAYDLKRATPDMIKRHVEKYGEGNFVEAEIPGDSTE